MAFLLFDLPPSTATRQLGGAPQKQGGSSKSRRPGPHAAWFTLLDYRARGSRSKSPAGGFSDRSRRRVNRMIGPRSRAIAEGNFDVVQFLLGRHQPRAVLYTRRSSAFEMGATCRRGPGIPKIVGAQLP